MGYYINPPDMSKEEWLAKNGIECAPETAKAHSMKGSTIRVVCLVDNFEFTAAAIAYTDEERDHFFYPDRSGFQRPRKWYLVEVEKLKPYLR